MQIDIIIREKIARKKNEEAYFVCGNSDIKVAFDFDEEWEKYETKTARFSFNGGYTDVIFDGNVAIAPILKNTLYVKVGVFAGDLHTTTPAYFNAKKSILCEEGSPHNPPEDVYAQIMEMLNNLDAGNAVVTDISIKKALGYTPAKQEDVENIKTDINNIKTDIGEAETLLASI